MNIFLQQSHNPSYGISVSVNPNFIEEINSSDYVCMTSNLNNSNTAKTVSLPLAARALYTSETPDVNSTVGVSSSTAHRMRQAHTAVPPQIGQDKRQHYSSAVASSLNKMSPVEFGREKTTSPTPSQSSSKLTVF